MYTVGPVLLPIRDLHGHHFNILISISLKSFLSDWMQILLSIMIVLRILHGFLSIYLLIVRALFSCQHCFIFNVLSRQSFGVTMRANLPITFSGTEAAECQRHYRPVGNKGFIHFYLFVNRLAYIFLSLSISTNLSTAQIYFVFLSVCNTNTVLKSG